MKLLGRSLLAAALCVGARSDHATQTAPVEPAPEAEVSLTLPGRSSAVRVKWRQFGRDLAAFREADLMGEKDLRKLQVASLLAQGGAMQTDVSLRVGAHTLAPGRHPLGFTVGSAGFPRFVVADGQDAHGLPFEGFEPGWDSPRLLLQLVYVSPNELRLDWHHGTAGGRLRIGVDWPEGWPWPPADPPPTGDAPPGR